MSSRVALGDADKHNSGLVIGVSHYCAILYRLKAKRSRDFGHMTFEPRNDGRAPWRQILIDYPGQRHVCAR